MLKVLLAIKSCVCHLGLRSLADSCFFLRHFNLSEHHLKSRNRYDEWLILCGFDSTMNFYPFKG